MAGGLMQLVTEGQQNVILNGNPEKTFWKATYLKYTNFGKQNFRLDFEGTPTLSLTTGSTFTFKVKRYADLLMDCYVSIALPNIWSPIYPPQAIVNPDGTPGYTDWAPYEFKWIDNIGALMIETITITCGNQKLQEYSGRYLLSSIQRDFSEEKLKLLPTDKFIFSTSDFENFEEFKVHDNNYYHYIAGGCFIMHKSFVNLFAELYRKYMDKYLSQNNWVNTEQKLLTHMYTEHRGLFYCLTHGYGAVVSKME
jgi:hypothetical protein